MVVTRLDYKDERNTVQSFIPGKNCAWIEERLYFPNSKQSVSYIDDDGNECVISAYDYVVHFNDCTKQIVNTTTRSYVETRWWRLLIQPQLFFQMPLYWANKANHTWVTITADLVGITLEIEEL